MKKLIFVIFFIFGCAGVNRSSDSGYAEKLKSGNRNSGKKRTSDMTFENRSQHQISDRTRLQSLENSLSTKNEIEQYSKTLPLFQSDQERIEYLEQPSFEEKQTWLNQKNFLNRSQKVEDDMRELVEAQDITLGMPQVLVKKSWGEPDIVEVSGNPKFKNERWRYNRYVSTSDGYKPEKKTVYFEGGRVVGWEVE